MPHGQWSRGTCQNSDHWRCSEPRLAFTGGLALLGTGGWLELGGRLDLKYQKSELGSDVESHVRPTPLSTMRGNDERSTQLRTTYVQELRSKLEGRELGPPSYSAQGPRKPISFAQTGVMQSHDAVCGTMLTRCECADATRTSELGLQSGVTLLATNQISVKASASKMERSGAVKLPCHRI
ncbi:uncharacterized protein F5Z01DRAFT_347019 [Emericellopsis atlantica]|uniref:Uncharacterized protein n=1 Tax=Emericellopsis atlantica TaxID=2614577 RepID=A0A9P7ZF08_9HYPO|nr:uncharacterized protein F5Z01DRAFT_347019 [Emericellopsis atlantica]KAG9250736.1 hypothetical protein F5Z01DRAFT_347019 [Emericellopsis atlantica]